MAHSIVAERCVAGLGYCHHEDSPSSVRQSNFVPIQQGLADLDPDVDAIWRLAHPELIGQVRGWMGLHTEMSVVSLPMSATVLKHRVDLEGLPWEACACSCARVRCISPTSKF